jgi:hypothetical protein
VLRRIYGPKRKTVAGGRRRLHNEELHNLYASPNIVRVIGGHVAGMSDKIRKKNVGKPEGKRPLGRHRRRWEDNIRMNLRGIG